MGSALIDTPFSVSKSLRNYEILYKAFGLIRSGIGLS